MDLDHVALALRDARPALELFVGRLGAVVLDGGQSIGFRIVQVRVGRPPRLEDPGAGMTVELMEPWAVDRFDFLARFLDHRGEGPHHLTFKTTDLRGELERLRAAGYRPVRENLDNPWWREAFLHPKETYGVVIQLAEATFDPSLVDDHEPVEGEFGSVEWWPEPPPRAGERAVLRRVVLGVPEVAAAATFFEDVLRGSVIARTETSTDLSWSGGGCIRVEERPGAPGVDRLECELPGEPGELTVCGTHLRLSPPER